MATGSNDNNSPVENLKRAIGQTARAIAGDEEVEIIYAAAPPQADGKIIYLPELSRTPSEREIAVMRGWADSLSLNLACHDDELHRRLLPAAG